jgi:hypothetical protein
MALLGDAFDRAGCGGGGAHLAGGCLVGRECEALGDEAVEASLLSGESLVEPWRMMLFFERNGRECTAEEMHVEAPMLKSARAVTFFDRFGYPSGDVA